MSETLLEELNGRYPSLGVCLADIQAAIDAISETYDGDGTLLVCGNGGSAADAEHIVGEMMKGFVRQRPVPLAVRRELNDDYLADNLQAPLRAIALTGQLSLSTAFSNDVAPDMVFAQQVLGFGRKGDVLLGLTTSGNSRNVVNAVKVARARGLKTVGMTGATGGELKALCDVCICVPETETYKVQELHMPVYHALCMALETRFFGP